MTTKKKGFLPRVEVLIVLVFFFSFIVWAVSKCGTTKAMYEQAAEFESVEDEDLDAELPNNASSTETADVSGASTVATSPAPQTTTTTQPTATATQPATTTQTRTSLTSGLTKLYITIDELNFRNAPHLDSPVVMKLPLHEVVYFLDEVTDFKQKISLGTEMANEPWVKVRHRRGYEGWVYGAGISYYKQKPKSTTDE